MSLRVWLPLTKDLRNQGLSNVAVTNNGAMFNSAGKLGGCYTFTNQIITVTPTALLKESFSSAASLACWVKLSSSHNSWAQCLTFGVVGTAWTQIYFGIDINSSGIPYVNVANGSNYTNCSSNTAIKDGNWHHISATFTTGTIKIYIDGVLKNSASTSYTPAWANTTVFSIGGNSSEVFKNGDAMNDVRLYNHCLSPMEVKELSKGLLLHYPLSDNSIQSLDNCYVYPRFETSSSSGGWYHWGSSGHVGTYGQTTDTNYIFRNGQTYAHWVANGSSATKDYLLYQEPAFDGGLRSLVAICKEENSKPITNNICYATWNARNGGVANDSWASIQSLGDGFYLCKCEGISQDGSNDLVGIYVKPGYKVYFSEVYLENNRTISSDIFFPTNIVYDCSGLCNNGVISGTLTVSNDTPKYQASTKFPNNCNTWIVNTDFPQITRNLTFACWCKIQQGANSSFSFIVSQGRDNTQSGFNIILNGTEYALHGSFGALKSGVTVDNTWKHIVGTYDGTTIKIYINGELKNSMSYTSDLTYTYGPALVIGKMAYSYTSTANYFPTNGNISDVRIYATALSADDVKSLYQNSAYIDSSGNVYGAVHSEV